MTSPSRKKRPITAPARTTPPTTGHKLALLVAVCMLPLGLGALAAQTPRVPATTPDWRGAPPLPIAPNIQATDYVLPIPPSRPLNAIPPARPRVTAEIQQTQARMDPNRNQEDSSPISLEIPGNERIFGRLDTESGLQERIRQEIKERVPADGPANFPDEVILSKDPYPGRTWPSQFCYVEPNYLIHNRLYFQELNSERYGWDLGALSPVVSSLYFAKDVLLFPYHFGTDILRGHETNTGYCLPGDPVPYFIYPPEISLSGGGVELATAITLLAVFP